MRNFALDAGKIALLYQGKVKNIKKAEYDLPSSSYKRDGLAKCLVDEMIQELFLAGLYRIYPKARLNVEEETPLVFLFQKNLNSPLTVHLDPLDGTRGFLAKKKNFTVGMAISNIRGDFTHSVIYAPGLDRLFIASPTSRFVLDKKGRKHLFVRKGFSKVIYEKRLLSGQGKRRLKRLGFKVSKIMSSHLGILNVSLRKAAAFLYGGANPHDSHIPFAFAKGSRTELLSVKGKKIESKDLKFRIEKKRLKFQRIPSVCYFSCDEDTKKKILEVLSQKANLHPEYLENFAEKEDR